MSSISSKTTHLKSYVIFSILLLIIITTAISWFHQKSTNDFFDFHKTIAQESTEGVSQQISTFISEQNRLVSLFANEHLQTILKVKTDPDNEEAMKKLSNIIKLYFPNHFSFTLAGLDGEPLFPDFDGFISDSCKNDIKEFNQKHHYNPYIHPNSESYHFDIMANFGNKKNNKGILFISFHADIMGNILKSVEVPGHKLMLIYPDKKDLIEVINEGARNHLNRDDYRLSQKEKTLILKSEPVIGTRWVAVDFQNPGLFSKKQNESMLISIMTISIISIICFIFILRLNREEKQRKTLETEKNQMIGLIAHEFRTPLTGISGAVQLLKLGRNLNDSQAEIIEILHSSSEKMKLLVDDFLDIQTLESRNFKLEITQVPVLKFINDAIGNNKLYGKKFNVEFKLLGDTETLKDINFAADPNRAHQVFNNLLSNAVKYGGSNKNVEIDVILTEQNIQFNVQDYGKGIPLEFQPKVFQRFSKAGNLQVSDVTSSGLGLNICKKIMEKHHGQIGFTSVDNVGTCFYVIFQR